MRLVRPVAFMEWYAIERSRRRPPAVSRNHCMPAANLQKYTLGPKALCISAQALEQIKGSLWGKYSFESGCHVNSHDDWELFLQANSWRHAMNSTHREGRDS